MTRMGIQLRLDCSAFLRGRSLPLEPVTRSPAGHVPWTGHIPSTSSKSLDENSDMAIYSFGFILAGGQGKTTTGNLARLAMSYNWRCWIRGPVFFN